MIGDPIGIHRHHKSCQLGHLHQDNCQRKALKGRHYGLRICRFHKDLIEMIRYEAEQEGTIGGARRHPVRRRSVAA